MSLFNIAAQSIPVDVPSPSPRYSWMIRSVDLIDEDSGLASCKLTIKVFFLNKSILCVTVR